MIRLILTAAFLFTVLIPSAQAETTNNEGAGLIRSDLEGALPKGLWRNQNRSEIIYLLKNMPANGPSRAVQQIKRNMLLSYYDTSVITNDIQPKQGNDLLTLRLEKLVEMGLWEDAFKLYTQTITDPGQNNKLAQIGVLLIMNQKGLSTACLEEKVLNARFADDSDNTLFWKQIDQVCALELGIKSSENKFPNSSTLQAIFFGRDFMIDATNISRLAALSPLEASILRIKGRIKYQNFDFTQDIPPFITKTFMEDDNFPENFKPALENQARKQALFPTLPLSENQQNQLENPSTLTQSQVKALIAAQLQRSTPLSQDLLARLTTLASTNPENYYYIQILNEVNALPSPIELTQEQLALGIESAPENKGFHKEYTENVILLQSSLDINAEFSNNLGEVYEKQVSLTPKDGYVMSTGSPKTDLATWLGKTTTHNLTGLSLLIILSNNEEDVNGTKATSLIKSLSTVGLIEQAHHLAKQELAKLMTL